MTARPSAVSPVRLTTAVPGLRYVDAPAAIAWLVDVLGAEARQVHSRPDGTVAHAELWFGGGGCVMLGSGRDDGLSHHPGHGSIYLAVPSPEDVDALHARVVAAGGRIVRPPHGTDYGSRDFSFADAEGNLWHVGTYVPA